MLARMLGAHSMIHAPAEPHLLTPLAHLGYYERVEAAPYDPFISQSAIRNLVTALPGGESDYRAALRAHTDSLYEHLLQPTQREFLLDKTPAYALTFDFLATLYPKARYVVLTRHPMAIWSSVVDSFFDGDHVAAHAHNPVIERYVPAIARLIREGPVEFCHLRYEELVQDPETHIERVCDHLRIPFESAMVDYGAQAGGAEKAPRGLGDPMTVAKHTRPTAGNLSKWAKAMSGHPDKVEQCQRILDALLDPDLEAWGFTRNAIEAELRAVEPEGIRAKGPKATLHTLERKLLVSLRRDIHHNAFGRLVRKIRLACDVLLR